MTIDLVKLMPILAVYSICCIFSCPSMLYSEVADQEEDNVDRSEERFAEIVLPGHIRFMEAITEEDGGLKLLQVSIFQDIIYDYHEVLRRSDAPADLYSRFNNKIWRALPRFDVESTITSKDPFERMDQYRKIWDLLHAHSRILREWGYLATQNMTQSQYLGFSNVSELGSRLYVDLNIVSAHMRDMTQRIELGIRQLNAINAFETADPSESNAVVALNHIGLHAVRQNVMMGWTLYMNALVNLYNPDLSMEPIRIPSGTNPVPVYPHESVLGQRINSAVIEKLSVLHNDRGTIQSLHHFWYGEHAGYREFVQFMRLSGRKRLFQRLIQKQRWPDRLPDQRWPDHFPSREEGWTGPMQPSHEHDE